VSAECCSGKGDGRHTIVGGTMDLWPDILGLKHVSVTVSRNLAQIPRKHESEGGEEAGIEMKLLRRLNRSEGSGPDSNTHMRLLVP
jgi:hypothetical protein